MSFKGEIETKCPNGCEPFETEVWSFIRGDQSPALREAVLAREVNLLLCPSCDAAFFPEAPYVYFEPQTEILAFVFPESYRAREDYWRGKMREDSAAMRKAFGPDLPVDLEPEIFFGPEELALLLEGEDYRSAEREVMECLAKDLGLSLYPVSPRYARQNGVPASLPYVAGRAATRQSVIRGLEKLIAANDRLATFAEYLKNLRSSAGRGLPPQSKPGRA